MIKLPYRYLIALILFFPVSLIFGTELKSSPLQCRNKTVFDSIKNQYKEYIYCKEANELDDLFQNIFYKNSYSHEESQLIKNQLNDFLGVKNLFDKKKRKTGFPEQRIARDSMILWKTYNEKMNNKFKTITKYSQDIPNGYDSSLGN